MLSVTALMDDRAPRDSRLTAEHGLSLLIDYNGRKILFDCGAGPAFLENARKLELNLSDLDAVILSHNHYDHGGGFPALAERSWGELPVYTGVGFFRKKIALRASGPEAADSGFGPEFLEKSGFRHREVSAPECVFPGAYLISGFPRVTPYETVPERFRLWEEGKLLPDLFTDEICLALETAGGLAVVVGCSHPGIVNMLAHVSACLARPVRAVFGGTHLVDGDDDRIQKTVDELKAMGLEILGFGHCTGEKAENMLLSRQDIQSCHLAPGDRIVLE